MVAFLLVLAAYYVLALCIVIVGFTNELLSAKYRHGRLHRILWQLHTGLHISPHRTYGDERSLRRTAGASNRATPDGLIVLYHPWKRGYRASRNNIIVVSVIGFACGLVQDTQLTVQLITVTLILLLFGMIGLKVRKARKNRAPGLPRLGHLYLNKQVVRRMPALAGIPEAMTVPEQAQAAVPHLETEVPTHILAGLLSREIGCSVAELSPGLKVRPDQGQLILPDSFAAVPRMRDPVEEIIAAHVEGKVSFAWSTTTNPRTLTWRPVKTSLPSLVLFRDYIDQMEKLAPGEFGVGVQADGSMYVADHNGEFPWHCRVANAGTGKSTGFLAKAAQVAHRDPSADIYCVDTKQISFEHIKGIPGIHVYDDPQKHMDDIWNVFYILTQLMDDRYAAVRERRATLADFNDVWLFVDEGIDLGGHLKSYYRRVLAGKAAQPPVWEEAIARLLRLGRQARIRGEWMMQDLTDRAFGGASLKMAFSEFGMAGYKKSQYERTIGTPVPALQSGVGRILMVRGRTETWVQGFYDNPEFLRAYASSERTRR